MGGGLKPGLTVKTVSCQNGPLSFKPPHISLNLTLLLQEMLKPSAGNLTVCPNVKELKKKRGAKAQKLHSSVTKSMWNYGLEEAGQMNCSSALGQLYTYRAHCTLDSGTQFQFKKQS